MSFTFQQQATPASITTTTSGTATFANAPQSGEMVVAVLAINSSTATITPPSGFAVKNEYKNTSRSLGVYWKKAGAGESTGYTFNFSASVSGTIIMRRYSSSIGWDTDQSGGATDKVWDSTGTVSQVSLNLTTTLNRLVVGIGYASNTSASNKQLNPNSGWSDNTLQYSSRVRSAHRTAAGGSEALGYQLTDSTLDNRLAFMAAEFVEYALKNAVAGNKTLAKSWNNRRYSDPSKVPAQSDTTPDAFTFTDQTGVALSSTITSAAITVSGINAATSISSSGGTFDINSSGTFVSSGTVNNGDTVRARVTSSSSNSTAANCVVTIGGASDTFTVTTVASGGWQLAAGHFEPSRQTLEIIAPQAGLSTTNRYYKAYPGLLYRVPVSVLGGAWPFKYELTAAPSGMTIGSIYGDTDYGIINWSNPITSGSPHTVTVKVTDQEGTIVTVTYTLTVTTSGFIFVDPVNGNASAFNGGSGTGTLANPFRTIGDWYNGDGSVTGSSGVAYKLNNTFANYFVYYRSGTHHTDSATIEDGIRLACINNLKPLVHLAYPGEAPVMSVRNSHFSFYSGINTLWFSGLYFQDIGASSNYKTLVWETAPNCVSFENKFQWATDNPASGSNSSYHFCGRTSDSANFPNKRISIIGCTIEGESGYNYLLAYDAEKIVIENNTVSNSSLTNGFYFKENNRYADVRNNVGLTGHGAYLVRVDGISVCQDIDVRHNLYKSTNQGLHLGDDATHSVGAVYDRRNTWIVPYNEANGISMTGSWETTRNVIRHDGTYSTFGGGIGRTGTGNALTITNTSNLTATTGLVDSSTGLLTGTDRANYLGIRGYEVA